MRPVDLHPDELLDPERRRILTAQERARLENHLAVCVECAFEAAAKDDFARLLERMHRGEDAAAARVADRAKAALAAVPSPSRRPPLPRPAPRWSRRLLVAAAVVAGTAAAAAGTWYLVHGAGEGDAARVAPPAVPATCPPAPAAGPMAAQPPRDRAVASSRFPVAGPGPSPTGAPAPFAPVPPPAVPAEPVRDRASPSASGSRVRPAETLVRPPALPPVEPVAAPAAAPDDTAAALFARANQVRRSGDYAGAARLYRDVLARFPGTREEVLSRVTLGRVLLDRLADPAGALDLFDRYLAEAPDGTLAEEALVGRALALTRLGRAEEERQAWTTLLARHPGSASAQRARERLEELGDAER